MPTSSVETDIQQDLQALIRSIGLAHFETDAIRVREQPKITEAIDKIPAIFICSRGPNKSDSASFEGTKFRGYVQEIMVIDGREGDAETDQPQTQFWKEQCVEVVQRHQTGEAKAGQDRLTLPTATTVYDLAVGDVEGIERSKLGNNYAVASFFVTVRSSE